MPLGKPGELIRSEAFDEYDLPYTVSSVRILYHSRSATGEDVAASGVVLYPTEAKPPAGGWPVIAWAHAATGVARSCAPSLTRNLGNGPFFSMYVSLGYAVVAPDYAGLGTNPRNAFLDSQSNAADLINSTVAARSALPQLSARWIVMGEAEGVLVAVAVAEKQDQVRDPGYLGSILISGFAGAKELYEPPPGDSAPFLSLAYGIQTVYPQFRVADILTNQGLPFYRQIGQSCSATSAERKLAPEEVMKPGWMNNPFVIQYFARNSLGQSKAYGPMLAISGDAGESVPASATALAISRLCKLGDQIQGERYPDQNTGSVIGDSVRDQIAWIEARFAGRAATSNCQ
jgi:hypothetical protein